jgi:tRNA modification GTPase
MEVLADADVVLVVLDSSQPVTGEDDELLNQVKERPAVVVENKADISSQPSALSFQLKSVRTSALTGQGLSELRNEILHHVGADDAVQVEAGFLTSMRHQGLVRDSLKALDGASEAVHSHVPHEMLLLDLYNALRPLDEITGATTTDDILDLIFSTFCIGK